MTAWRMLAMARVILLCARAGVAAEFKSSQGFSITDVQVERTRVSGLEAVSVHYNAKLRGVAQPQRQWQITVPDKRRTLSITCLAPEADFAKYEPVFAAAVNSLRIGPDPPLPAGWITPWCGTVSSELWSRACWCGSRCACSGRSDAFY